MAPKTERDLLEEISRKLDRLIALQAIQGKDLDTQIDILTRVGLTSSEIGPLLGQHPDSVRRRRSKKQKAKSRPRPEGSEAG